MAGLLLSNISLSCENIGLSFLESLEKPTILAFKWETLSLIILNSIFKAHCYREEQIMALCWICFFNIYFPLLLFSKKKLFIQKSLPQGTLPPCLNIKPKCLCSGPGPFVDGRKEGINTYLLQRLVILGNICKINNLFTLLPHLPCPTLFYKRTWHPDPNNMVILRH